MKFYAGSSDNEAETPYGVVICRGLEEVIRGDGAYYGSVEVRVVTDIDDSDADAQLKRLALTKMVLIHMPRPARDDTRGVVVKGVSPGTWRSMPGRNVAVDLIPLEMGLEDETPEAELPFSHRVEAAFADHLEQATGG